MVVKEYNRKTEYIHVVKEYNIEKPNIFTSPKQLNIARLIKGDTQIE